MYDWVLAILHPLVGAVFFDCSLVATVSLTDAHGVGREVGA